MCAGGRLSACAGGWVWAVSCACGAGAWCPWLWAQCPQGAARSLPWMFRAPSLGPFRHRDDLPTGAQAWPRAERARQSLLADEDDA